MPMERVDHHDATRAGVSSTAVAVAYARAVESAKALPLCHDPFASLFCPPSAIEAKGGFLLDGKQTTVEMRRFLVDMLAVRTRESRPVPRLLLNLSALFDFLCRVLPKSVFSVTAALASGIPR